MPSPKSGSAGTAELPAAPPAPQEAATSQAGELQETAERSRELDPMEPGSTTLPGQESGESQGPLTWVGIELKDEDDNPIPHADYKVKLPDGSIQSGSLDDEGKARIEGVPSGSVEVAFPQIHGDEWFKA
jgi:hypothetical protein